MRVLQNVRMVNCWMLGVVLLTACIGCGSGEDYQPVSGTVTLDSEPLKKGVITMFPTGTGTTVGGEIIDGKFTLPRDRGPSPGKYRVEIVAFKASGKKEFDVDLNKQVDVELQYLPAKYNNKSELTCTVEEGGKNSFEFALVSK